MKLISLLFVFSIFLSPQEFPVSVESSPSPIKKYHNTLMTSLRHDLIVYEKDPAVGTYIQNIDWQTIETLLASLETDHVSREIIIAGQSHAAPTEIVSDSIMEDKIIASQDAIHSLLVSIGKDVDLVMVEGFVTQEQMSKQSILDIVKLEPVYNLSDGWSYNVLDGEKRFEQSKRFNAIYRVIDSKDPGHSFYGAEEASLHQLDVAIKLMAYHFAKPGRTKDYFLKMDSVVGNQIRTIRSSIMLAQTVKKMQETNNSRAILVVGKNHGFDFVAIEQQRLLPSVTFMSFSVQ